MEDEGGVLGNLPRSRPGRRSQKRTGGGAGKRPADTTRRAAARSERRSTKAARSPGPDRPAKPPQGAPGNDPVGDAVRLATQVPLAGVRVAAGVTRELLRRLPRP
jgi:hypothetical protein